MILIVKMMSSDSSFICDECGMPFSSKGELEMHNETLHPEKAADNNK